MEFTIFPLASQYAWGNACACLHTVAGRIQDFPAVTFTVVCSHCFEHPLSMPRRQNSIVEQTCLIGGEATCEDIPVADAVRANAMLQIAAGVLPIGRPLKG